MLLVSYRPVECKLGIITNCEELVAYARFDVKAISELDS